MILYDNDFGCIPDGRFLEQAGTTEGSAVLTDADGGLRPTDVGKNIAVPGAADLETTIVGLIELGDVKEVVMGGTGMPANRLQGKLFKPGSSNQVPFDPDAHVGRRINVAGAGMGGPLITTIANVINATTVDLEDDFQNPVANSTAIVYREDCVTLADYARASVKDVTVELEGRTIHDAAMIVGGRLLFSATAKFSSEDLSKDVTIPGAGLHITTIASFENNSKVILAAAAQRKVDKQQADVWRTDSRPGFDLLLASLQSLESQSVEIRFGPGVYDFRRNPEINVNAVIELFSKKNLVIRGAGPGVTILRLMPQQNLESANTHVIETRDCRHLTFCDFSIHGAYLTMGKTNEQMHGLFLNQGSENIVVERVRVFQTAGDGIRFLGKAEEPALEKPEKKVRNVRVENCQLIQNKRTGLAFQREVEYVSVRNCYIEMIPPSTDSCIDLEPTGNQMPGQIFVSPTDLIIESNFMKHGTPAPAVSISGFGGPDPVRRIKFSNNEINGGHIVCTDVEELTIQNNTVRVTPLGAPLNTGQRIPIYMKLGGDRVIITGNLLINDDADTKSVIRIEGEREIKRAILANNICVARAGGGIDCLAGDDIALTGNLIVATDACNNAIRVRSQSSPMESISIRNNDILVQGTGTWANGIRFSADPEQIRHISVIGNSIRGAKKGIIFEQNPSQLNPYPQMPVCALNRSGTDVEVPFDEAVSGQFNIIIGGVTSKVSTGTKPGSGRLILGRGDPENLVTGNVGDIFQRLDGQTDATLYVKETGNGTNIHWEEK